MKNQKEEQLSEKTNSPPKSVDKTKEELAKEYEEKVTKAVEEETPKEIKKKVEELSKEPLLKESEDVVWESGMDESPTIPLSRPPSDILPAIIEDYDKKLSDPTSVHGAVRNVKNVSSQQGVNRPVIAGYGPRQRNTPQAPTQSLKSIPGRRTGVFVPNPNTSINDNTKTSHR